MLQARYNLWSQSDGSLPKLTSNPYSWTKVANILFIDSPVGAGFSYSKTAGGNISGDRQTCWQTYKFFKKWLIGHPEFLPNPIYVGGISYGGFTVPLVVQHISDANKAGIEPFVNLKGYLLGNPAENTTKTNNSRIQFAHGMGLLPDELYESMKNSCAGEYTNVDTNNFKCLEDVQAYSKCIAGINFLHILEPKCTVVSPKPNEIAELRRSLVENVTELLYSKLSLQLNSEPQFPALGCRAIYVLHPTVGLKTVVLGLQLFVDGEV
ncbi:hypothetical protein GIB67_009569 [Kingdonia uniflora]|uniref:Serine carboxypeptidase-like 18 n=1 Tax=Kingdonia uniflora TaxID=39325 RepID=A0A7J7NX03_9MAGN|nr:hypothetical protein GIB67_009569 [Kingdonia uniflora]